MTEPTKEQIDKWYDEGRRYLIDYFVEASSLEEIIIDSSDSEIDRDEWIDDVINSNTQIGQVEAYLAAKKSDFEEIKTLKEQLAEAVELLRKKGSSCAYTGMAIDFKSCYCWHHTRQRFLEKQDKENKDEK